MVDYLRNQHLQNEELADPLTPTKIDDLQRFIITPLRDRGILFHDMNKTIYLQFLNELKTGINEYKDSDDIVTIYPIVNKRLKPNYEQPRNVTNEELQTLIHRGVDNLIAQENRRNLSRRKIRQKKLITTMENLTTLPTNVIRHISEYNTGRLRGGRKSRKKNRKSKKGSRKH